MALNVYVRIKVQVQANDTVDILKAETKDVVDSPENDQRFIFRGQHLHNNDRTLADCNIKTGATIDLVGTTLLRGYSYVFVRLRVHALCWDTLHTLKGTIQRRLRIPRDQQRLHTAHGYALENDHILVSPGILNGAIFTLVVADED